MTGAKFKKVDLCTWCGVETAEKFCSEDCRQDFNTACRVWAAQEYEAERLSIFTLRSCLEQHTRGVERGPASEGTTDGPRARTCPDGPPRGAAPVTDVR